MAWLDERFRKQKLYAWSRSTFTYSRHGRYHFIMDLFPSPQDSYAHSLSTLQGLNAYDDFMDSLKVICDMGCGYGNDLVWWANNSIEDEHGNRIPRNYKCIGVDKDVSRIDYSSLPRNARVVEGDFESRVLSVNADLIWSHDSFRYAVNPLETLKVWNSQMNEDGMIVLIVPQTINIVYNKPAVRTFPGCFYNYTITNLLYMLAVNGFDCNGGQFTKQPNDPWIQCIAYKSDQAPMDPKTTNWYDLTERKLLPDSAEESIKRWGYLKQEDLMTHWIDGQYCMWNRV